MRPHFSPRRSRARRVLSVSYAWAGVVIMWAFWVAFVIFLSSPRHLLEAWPLPSVDGGKSFAQPFAAGVWDAALIGLFAAQHSLMARASFKARMGRHLSPAFIRCTYVHAANLALLILLFLWQPIDGELWHMEGPWLDRLCWALFSAGWLLLLVGAWSFGIGELLGVAAMRAWVEGRPHPHPRLRTGWIYRGLRHPMYVGVLCGVWATPRMTIGHALLATGLTAYVAVALRYEEHDLRAQFGASYLRWRSTPTGARAAAWLALSGPARLPITERLRAPQPPSETAARS